MIGLGGGSQMWSIPVVFIGIALFVAACGEGEDAAVSERESSQSVVTDTTATSKERPPRSTAPTTDDDRDIHDLLRGRKPVRTPGGGLAYLPQKPTASEAAPSQGCVDSEGAESTDANARPPRPGIRAIRLDGRRLRVSVWFRDVPARCTPDRIRITVDVNDDPAVPAGFLYPIDDVAEPFVVTLPERVRDADVISASSISTRGGSFTDSPRVLISGDGRDNGR